MERQKNSSFEDNLQKIYSNIEEVAGELAIDVKTLSSAQPNEATPPKLLRAGLAARGEIVKQMESLTEKLIRAQAERHRISCSSPLDPRQRFRENGDDLWKSAKVCCCSLSQNRREHKLRPDSSQPSTGRVGERDRQAKERAGRDLVLRRSSLPD